MMKGESILGHRRPGPAREERRMSRPPSKVDAQLEASLRRISGALEHNRNQYAAVVGQILAATGAEVAERIAAKTEDTAARIAERHQRRMDQWQRRRERRLERQGREDAAAVPRGIVFTVAAIICMILAVRQPGLFWMVFVALGFGMSAASSFGRAARRGRAARDDESEAVPDAKPQGAGAGERTPSPQAAAEPADPKVARIQGLCDKILAELESGPPIVREVVTEPRATIGGLRQACLETARRERELRGVLAAQDEAGLVAERDALAARLSSERDEIVRDRLGQALRALEQQLAHRAELTTAATRLEAENTRILYTLENLHMQLLRARSTDIGGPELGGKLRDSLRDLGTQIDAVAEALEWASAPATPGAPNENTAAAPGTRATLDAGATAAGTPAATETERAEREAASRRAAQAREAQRH
jgi:hypothetical protein